MQNFADKYEFKSHIAKMLAELDINKETFEKIFANVFVEIYEKEKNFLFLTDLLKVSVVNLIIEEITKIKKTEKSIFLPLFEDYQKLNGELSDLIAHIIKETEHNPLDVKNTVIEIERYPILYRITEHKDLTTFKPEYITTAKFIEFFESNIGKYGLYFLYNINKELVYVGKSISLGETILNSVWEKNIDGYVAIAYTKTKADIHVYEPYYILKEKPLLNFEVLEKDELSISLKPLKISALVKIYENN